MQEIAELEKRITAALERIGRGLEGMAVAPAEPPSAMLPESDFARLNDALEEERMANAQLAERLRVHRDREAALAAELAELTARVQAEAAERDAERDAELSGLRAERAGEAAELADILSALNPLIEEAARNA